MVLIILQEWEIQVPFRFMLGTLFDQFPSHHASMAVPAKHLGNRLHFLYVSRVGRSIFHAVRRTFSSSAPGILRNGHHSLLYVAATRDDWWNYIGSDHIPSCPQTWPVTQTWHGHRGTSGSPFPSQLKYAFLITEKLAGHTESAKQYSICTVVARPCSTHYSVHVFGELQNCSKYVS